MHFVNFKLCCAFHKVRVKVVLRVSIGARVRIIRGSVSAT